MAQPNSSCQLSPLSVANVDHEESDDALEQLCEQPLALPSLKNEILTDGMQVSAVGCGSSAQLTICITSIVLL